MGYIERFLGAVFIKQHIFRVYHEAKKNPRGLENIYLLHGGYIERFLGAIYKHISEGVLCN
jgi:hypothetical protein